MKDVRFPMVMSTSERQVLKTLADQDGLSEAATLRMLLRREARYRGLWPVADNRKAASHETAPAA